MLTSSRSKVSRLVHTAFNLSLVATLLLSSSCNQQSQTVKKLAQDSKQVQDFDNSLTFNSVTLEESDEKGQLWWKVKAKQASYSKDKKTARIQEPIGELYQDGKAILKVSAKTGEFLQKEKKIFLRGEIKAIDIRDGLTLNGNELEWQPTNYLLIVRNNVTGDHKQVKMSAKEGQYKTRKRQLDLQGQVVAVTNSNLHFRTEALTWLVNGQTLTSNKPIQIDRYQGQAVTAQATANQGVGNLKTRTVTLQQNARVVFQKPTLQVASNNLVWMPDDQLVESNQPVTVINPSQQITVAGDQGKMNLKSNIAYLNGNVRGVSERKQAQLNSNSLIWNLTTQQFEAEGNVVYRQAGQPPLNLTGPKAFGELQGQTVVVSGGQVETQFIP